jgi:hypothetical protein
MDANLDPICDSKKKSFHFDLPIGTFSLLFHFNASKMLLKIILYAENATRQYLQPFLDRFPQKFRVRSQVRKTYCTMTMRNCAYFLIHTIAPSRDTLTGCVNSCIRQWFGSLLIEYVSDPDPGFLVIPYPSGPYPGFWQPNIKIFQLDS